MANILYCASTWSHLRQFHLPYIERLRELGCTVHLAAGGERLLESYDRTHPLPIRKKILSWSNIHSIRLLMRLLRHEKIEIITVHTTLAAALCRIATLLSRWRGTLVYTCHGYLFTADEEGKASKSFKSLFYLACEKLLARQTDRVIVMNRQDYKSARRYGLCRSVALVPGMGVEAGRCVDPETSGRVSIREQLDIADDCVVFGCVGEFSKRKNQGQILQAYRQVYNQLPNSVLLFAGDGETLNSCRTLAERWGLSKNVLFLGHCAPMEPFYHSVDVLLTASRSEGLPFAVMEGLSYHIPTIASKVKGHTDLIEHGSNGLLYSPDDASQLAACMMALGRDREQREALSRDVRLPEEYNIESVMESHLQIMGFASRVEHAVGG